MWRARAGENGEDGERQGKERLEVSEWKGGGAEA
jgi:hypothetical protein